MRIVFKLALLVALACTIFGCAHNYYNIPQETLEKKVKVIGVAPFFTDPDSDLRHPQKDALVTLIRGYNAKNEKELIGRLRDTGIFYSVRPVDGDPVTLFSNLVANRERRDDAGIIYNKYFYKKDALRQLLSDNGLDAVMLVTVGGITRPGKVYSSNYLSFLETDFNYLILTAQLLDRDGNTVWEYPNFRRSALSYPMFFALQYPDFDEAAANLSDKVDVKFKTIPGISAAFAKTEPSAVKGPAVSTLYARQYDEMLSLMKLCKPLFGGKKEQAAPAPAPLAPYAPVAPESVTPPVTPVAPESTALPAAAPGRATAPAAPVPSAAPVYEPVSAAPAPAPREQAPEHPSTGDIVPEEPQAK